MWSPKPLLVISLSISVLSPCTAATGGKPLVSAVTKDAATSLYTAPLKDGRPLVLDLSGLVISLTTCASRYGTVTTLSANATNGANPLFPVSFSAVASCAPRQPNLPAGAVGVAGLAPSTQSFLAQVARTQSVANKLALCLPSDGKTTSGNSVGVIIYGGGPLIFPDRGDFTTMLAGTAPLHGYKGSPGYFVSATDIAVERNQVGKPGPLVVGLSSTTPYTALRPDVYAPFLKAFDQAASGPNFPWMTRVPSVAPFELCYDAKKLPPTRLGVAVPQIDLTLEGGSNFTVFGGNSMVLVNANTACLGFVKAAGQAPEVVLGGFQMENRLLVLDAENGQLGFTLFLNAVGLSCSNFNFTLAA
ncbi:hypothetical protein SETIT_4G169400v2 [Setaria italica]|uniref:Peptidase A1 domain-containing protein n=1 Tax=Setaria italica TaxID=4555 RepID=A0A368QX08_SETIT|nr:basic 7S globulin [Setaria italica]RCV21830.1 hypothetical protein SETIT_4G169400v2 [Setaria italica]